MIHFSMHVRGLADLSSRGLGCLTVHKYGIQVTTTYLINFSGSSSEEETDVISPNPEHIHSPMHSSHGNVSLKNIFCFNQYFLGFHVSILLMAYVTANMVRHASSCFCVTLKFTDDTFFQRNYCCFCELREAFDKNR